MSNLEQMPETLGRIRQQMSSLKQATGGSLEAIHHSAQKKPLQFDV